MLRHEAFCSALNGVAGICTCGAVMQAVRVQSSRVEVRERAGRSGHYWDAWLASVIFSGLAVALAEDL